MPRTPSQLSLDHFTQQRKRRQKHFLEADLQCQANQKLLALNQFGRDLEGSADMERVAHKMARLLCQLFKVSLLGIYRISNHKEAAHLLVAAGDLASTAPESLDPDVLVRWGIQDCLDQPGSAIAMVENPGDDVLDRQRFPSLIIAPVLRKQDLQGLILLANSSAQAFTPGDEWVIASAADRLAELWAFANRGEALIEFVQSVGNLSMVQETSSLMEMIASIGRRTLDASFTVVCAYTQKEWLLRCSGKAPSLFGSLQNCAFNFLDAAIKTPYTFRLRDLRTDPRSACIQLDTPDLCSLLVSPIIINGSANFLLLAFGKLSSSAFSEEDVFMADLLCAHAAQNLGSCFINEQLRHTLLTTQLLNDLNAQISQVETLNQAVSVIASTAFQLTRPRRCGLMLFTLDGRKEADVICPAHPGGPIHPYPLIQQAMNSRQTIYLAESDPVIQVAIPIYTQRRCYGALWLEFSESLSEDRHPAEDLIALVNQSTIGLERFILLEETRIQAKKLIQTYTSLEESYDQTLKALMRALDARDRETEGHSERVANLAVSLGQEMGLNKIELKALTRGSLLHDIGKIGISDKILLKEDSLTEPEWEIMRQHPRIGADIIQEIPALHDALQVIAFHQERWNGSGYPYKLTTKDIPLVARIFAVIDVYDALTSNRPYRPINLSMEEALRYLESQAGIHFDPDIVDAFTRMMRTTRNSPADADPATGGIPTHFA
jgi:HD-GYP domain-containing protein (c-di-GMP phosphodiesterase class II)/GAF domain-containing protein